MECFRIDESGYTGFDLLNNAQPFQRRQLLPSKMQRLLG